MLFTIKGMDIDLWYCCHHYACEHMLSCEVLDLMSDAFNKKLVFNSSIVLFLLEFFKKKTFQQRVDFISKY